MPDGTAKTSSPGLSRLSFLQKTAQCFRVRRPAKRESRRQRPYRVSAGGHHERVVRQLVPRGRCDDVPVRIDRLRGPERQERAARAREQAEVEVVRALETEGLGDGERPVPEVALGRDEFDVDHPPRERAEAQRSLERGDATAGDDDAKTSARG